MMLRMVESAAESDGNFVVMLIACVLGCFTKCIEDLLEFLSTYAFAYVAMYGQSFCQAARSTWDLLTTSGLHTLVTYDVTAAVTFLGGLFLRRVHSYWHMGCVETPWRLQAAWRRGGGGHGHNGDCILGLRCRHRARALPRYVF